MSNHLRNLRALFESAKSFEVSRKVDTYEYESLSECIRSDQVPAQEISEIFTDKAFYKWYKKKYWNDR